MTPLALYAKEAAGGRQGAWRRVAIQSNGRKRRTFLFELLVFAGEFDRAEKQLIFWRERMPMLAGTLLYRSALHAERTRQAMFANGEPRPKEMQYTMAPGMGAPSRRSTMPIRASDPTLRCHRRQLYVDPIHYLRKLEIELQRTCAT